MAAKIYGFAKIKAKLRKELAKIEAKSESALWDSAIMIRRSMETTAPIIPLDLGNLRASWFVNSFRTFAGAGVEMGFSANYAAAAHEMTDKKVNWSRPDSGPKFFEAALKRERKEIVRIIGIKAKV